MPATPSERRGCAPSARYSGDGCRRRAAGATSISPSSRREAVGVVARHRPAADLDATGGREAAARRLGAGDEEAGVVPLLHRRSSLPASSVTADGARLRAGRRGRPRRPVATSCRPRTAERVAVLGRDDRRNGAFADGAAELVARPELRAKGRLSPARAGGRFQLPRRHSPGRSCASRIESTPRIGISIQSGRFAAS